MLYIRGSNFDGRLLQRTLELVSPLLHGLLKLSELQPLNLGLYHSASEVFLLSGGKELLTTEAPLSSAGFSSILQDER